MEISFGNIQDNLVYHSNIFNYDKTLFSQVVNNGLKLNLSDYSANKNSEIKSSEDYYPNIKFLTSKSKEQISLLNTLTFELEGNYAYIHKDNIEELQISTVAKSTVKLILDLLSFSFNKYCEEEIIIRKNQQELANSAEAEKVNISNKEHYDNLLCCLLYLDGICMINIELIKCLMNIGLLLDINFYDLLNNILNSKYLTYHPKEIASHLLSMMIMQSDENEKDKAISVLEWTFQHYLENKRDNCLTSNCCLLLTNDECLEYFVTKFNEDKKCIKEIFNLMIKETNINIIYESLFTVWNISNNKSYFYIFEDSNVNYIECIIQTIRTNKIDKIARIGLQIIKNLLESQPCIEILFNQKFMRTIDILITNKWNDGIIKDLLNEIYEFLDKNYKITNSFDKYVKELETGVLKPGALHSTGFWEENFKEFEVNSFENIRRLVKIIQNGDSLIKPDDNEKKKEIEGKAIACFDLGEFARLYPGGAGILEHFGAKTTLLELIKSPDMELKNKALVCVQKIMMRSLKK